MTIVLVFGSSRACVVQLLAENKKLDIALKLATQEVADLNKALDAR